VHPSLRDTEHSHHPTAEPPGAVPGAPAAGTEGNGVRRVRVVVGGMTCSYCARAVERAIGRLEGVTAVRVDLAAGSADVDLDSASVSGDRLREAIRLAGYRTTD
jgi:Cu+-exporting ATPase